MSRKKGGVVPFWPLLTRPNCPTFASITSSTFLPLGDTILDDPQHRQHQQHKQHLIDRPTANRLRLPPPPSAQHDIQTRGPLKVVKSSHSHDQRLRRDFQSSSASSVSPNKLQLKHQIYPMPMEVAIRCSAPNCSCDCFTPGKTQMRICANCSHGWISHAIEKVVNHSHLLNSHSAVDNLQMSTAFDIASLILYGSHALPVRLKILLDRVLHTLERDELLHLLHGFGWTYDDYTRGYMLQDSSGNLFTRWAIISKEEEYLVLKLFLRFSETKNIAQNFVLQDFASDSYNSSSFLNKRDTDLKKYNERNNKTSISSLIKQSINNKHFNNSVKDVNPSQSLQSMVNSGSVKREISPKPIISNTCALPTMSPNDRKALIPNSHSPSAMSPLNRLQNMQPFDYRKNESTSKLASIASDIPIAYTQTTTPSMSPTTNSFPFVSSGLPLMPNNVSSISTNMTSTNSDMSVTDGLSDDDISISGAINLSQTSSAFALKKVKHLRKSANPMKRRWNPMVLSNLVTNPSTGKKRVQCHVCMKTFCDKGALKIHFSAVHLREMHKCTVDGCNMMFSSRRSRNRHSANPNPKLHTPNMRRKINPHDGRSANPYPLLATTSSSSLMNLTTNSLIGQNIDSNVFIDSENLSKDLDNSSPNKTSLDMDCDRDSLSPNSSCHSPESETAPDISHSIINNSIEKTENNLNCKPKNGSPEEGINLSLKDDLSVKKNVRKRKSLNPTKFAPIAMTASDDDMRYSDDTSDDSSSNTYIDRIDEEDNHLMDDSKSDFDSSDDIICSEDLNHSYLKKEKSFKDMNNKDVMKSCIDGTIDLSKKSRPSTPPAIDYKIQRQDCEPTVANKTNPTITSSESVVENPLRHLESLSMGSFSNIQSVVNARNHHKNSIFSSNSLHSLSFHAPGMGLSLRPPSPPTQHSISKQQNERQTNSSIKESECSPNVSTSSPNNAIPSGIDIDSCIGDHVSLMPPFRDASYIGQIEVPVDKENPRRCTACGKIFQNHFGVKTHYQNVHLKLMHKCTVDGCNASFPSKRSRDRHSANLNLHRKLLSTHSDGKSGFGLEKTNSSAMFPFPSASLRDDFFRIYDPQGLPFNLNDICSRLPPIGADGLFAASAAAAAASFPVMPGFHPAMCLPPLPTPSSLYMDGRSSVSRESPNSVRTTPSPSLNSHSSPAPVTSHLPSKSHRISSPTAQVVLEASLHSDESGKYACIYCQCCKSSADSLKDHYERVHNDILYRCSFHGCNKAFLDKKSKKKHNLFHNPINSSQTSL